jgi:hypothetical protein
VTAGSRASHNESPVGTKLWVIGAGEGGCDHPTDSLEAVGSDGANGYYECTRCGATLVFQDEVTVSGKVRRTALEEREGP